MERKSLLRNVATRKNFASVHLAILRQLSGSMFVVIYAKQVMTDLRYAYPANALVYLNVVQFLSGLLGIYLVKLVRRDMLIIVGTCLCGFINLIIGVADYY